ncbi:bifunctional diaminohydroxyphosphoribosylaminopyrimidine deaminase/5-amino-6-(5-phosphoribosylamino)uracil reductase RibD [Phenylobacterium sp. J426]|uniref:bifunctional diaminohydroxyphosphoribosylaminopyrimidine deaminase/5-amino-6-(5-phosphoribosylamino)uracil reductase RibD n=1 Tax=Phenylobacterium sp. J426 TaxID=2898439 RepID=UPI00215171DA|nr:bifunctional diaminohydroxyphosphoribosylaminopyrimidine deaminase/5-amino-6-(5-phosphoribosylamino)uracil reductase RibD [Phenylobacterium sp. J426]MCR5874572.1 bifunctional diaminohydroxyphosphoribosylaminopyrimidine deaminase/5-amino-6-(5-phosphoribosylamino)uracil reductase RibD [Phenylobacterium sp. J426]
MTDEDFMRRAIALAAAQVGRTGDNPAVGCVVVRDGEIVGEGATGDGGRPHAEELALRQAGESARGAVAYVTLEPCGARSSGAASCSELMAHAGLDRVVVACADSSVFAAGRGGAHLRASNITLDQGLLNAEAAELYRGYSPAKSLEIRR